MENKIFLNRYRPSLRRNGLPVELHRSPGGRTYRAQEFDTGREVALTIVAPAPHGASTLELLHSQCRAALEISQINIPRLYQFGRENGELIYVTEYCEGPTAAAWIDAHGPLELRAVLRIALQVADAMAATSFLRLYHPRLDPHQIVFVSGQTAEGDWPPVKIVDWFLPWAISLNGNSELEEEQPFGSPEQLQTGESDLASEIYSLGAIMLFLLTGVAVRGGAERSVASLRGTPRIVRHLLGRMLLDSPSERPQDPVALAAFLQTCLGRVERREKISRRFALPVLTRPRFGKEKSQHAPPVLFSVAIALGVIIVAALGMIFFEWPPLGKALAAATSDKSGTEIMPRDRSGVFRSSLGYAAESVKDANGTASPDVSESREKVAANDQAGEPPPAEGPDEGSPDSVTPEVKPSAGVAPVAQARHDEPSDIVPNEKPDQVVRSDQRQNKTFAGSKTQSPEPSAASAVASARTEDDEPATQSAELPETKQESARSAARKTAKKSATHPIASNDGDKRDHRGARTVKRGRAVPTLHVGRSPAELVGTTQDGRWILFVADSGQRIIVPPPPGYGD